jgi:glycosyltransferase involved in cell wall biosynthesis
MSRIKVLFISHDSTRSGAPLLLLNFIKWVTNNRNIRPTLLIKRKDVLCTEFKQVSKTLFFYEKKVSKDRAIIYKLYCHFFNSSIGEFMCLLVLKLQLIRRRPDVIYSNTISNGRILNFCNFLKAPVITHVHELQYLIDYFGEENLAFIKKNTQHYIACSAHVKNNLIKNVNIPEKAVSVVYSSIVPKKIMEEIPTNVDESLKDFCKGKKIIGGSGGLGWLKGTDFIVPLVKLLQTSDPRIGFIWVGGDTVSKEFLELMGTINKEGFGNSIFITGSVKDPIKYFSLMDIFVVLSREDSFPLVCLENAVLQKPLLCFKNTGGAEEILEDWPDNIIPYFDIENLAKRIIEILNNKQLSDEIGASLKKKVSNKFASEISFPKIYEEIQEQVNKSKLTENY